MRYIGIDVSKKKIDVFLPPEDYKIFPNNEEGFCALNSLLSPDDILGMESTGTYHHSCALFFLEKNLLVKEINPILTKQFIRATVRKKKTDKTDSKIISLLLSQGEGYLMQKESILNPLQKFNRVKRKLIGMRSSLKVQIQEIKNNKELVSLKNSLLKLIESYDEQIKAIEQKIECFSSPEIEILESIPGISKKLSREIFCELGDISRFSHKRKIVAYAGYDPKIKFSGSSVRATGKLTKRGSPFLRNALYLATFSNLRSQNVFGNYYRKKKKQGKHHFQAMTATSRKMLEIIFGLLSRHQLFSFDFS